jgi:type IV pilus assembly protein PilO
MAPPAAGKTPKIGSGVKLLLGFVGMAVLALLYFFFLFTDLSNAIKAAKDTNTRLKGDEAAAGVAYKAYLDDLTKLEEKKARSKDLNKVLPETGEMPSFLTNINQQAEVAGLKVKSVTPLDEQAQPYYYRVPVRLEVSGRFHQLAKFFAGVGRLDRIINVENIEMFNPVVGDNDETTLSAKCLTTTFHAKPAASGAPAGAGSAAPGAPPPPGAPK